MKTSLVMITTNRPNPSFSLLDKAIGRVNKLQTDIIQEKILSIDMFDPPIGERGEEDFGYIKDMGWKVLYGKPEGQANNQMRGLQEASHDWVLYCEDDTLIEKIPTADFLCRVLEQDIWFLTFCGHLRMRDTDRMLDYIQDHSNYIQINEDMVLIKNPSLCDGYMISFPAMFSNKEMLLRLFECSLNYLKKDYVELQLSRAWEELCPDRKIGIYLKPLDFDQIITRQTIHDNTYLRYNANDEALKHTTLDRDMTRI